MSDDLTEAPVNPASLYASPADLARDSALTLQEKRDLLEEWEELVRAELVAAEEGMTGRQHVTLGDILRARNSLPTDTQPRPKTADKS